MTSMSKNFSFDETILSMKYKYMQFLDFSIISPRVVRNKTRSVSTITKTIENNSFYRH